jgi:hypothetical protein
VVSIRTEERTSSAVWLWPGRVVACFFLVLGALVFSSFLDTGTWWILAFALAASGGALLFIVGLERPQHPAATWARRVGWSMMALGSFVPTSLLFMPFLLALLALPTVFARPREGTT